MAPVSPAIPSTSSTTKRRLALAVLITLAAGLVLAVNIASYRPFLADDALISLQYSQRLLQGNGLTWTDGSQPVEGYSNFLWVMAVAAAGSPGIDLVLASRILGVTGMLAAMLAFLYRFQTQRGAPGILAGMLSLALAGPIAAWAIGGLEQPLLAALLAWALVLVEPLFEGKEISVRRLLVVSALLGLLALTRPDGILFAGMLILALFATHGLRWGSLRAAICLALFPVLFYMSQLGFRLVYYGEWVPNTALVKVSLSRAHLRDGLLYLQQGLIPLAPLALLALASLLAEFFQPGRRGKAVLYLFTGGAWLGYIALVGGDIFPAWRHLVPVVVLCALLVSDGVNGLDSRLRTPRWRALAAGLLLAAFGLYGYLQAADSENNRAREEVWEWDGKVVGQALKTGFGAQAPLLAVEPGGCIPFWSQLPSIDMLGLNDYYIPRHPPASFGQGWIGHELGDGEYVLERQPDLVLFCLPTGSADPCYMSGKQMTEHPEFYEQFSLVNFRAGEALYGKPGVLTTQLWVRREGGKTGIQREPGQISIPGYFLTAGEKSAAVLDGQGRWAVETRADAPAWLRDLKVPGGSWRVEVDASQPVRVSVYRGETEIESGGNTAFSLTGKAVHVHLKVTAENGAALVTGLRLVPAP